MPSREGSGHKEMSPSLSSATCLGQQLPLPCLGVYTGPRGGSRGSHATVSVALRPVLASTGFP